jgi:hypothetical protein
MVKNKTKKIRGRNKKSLNKKTKKMYGGVGKTDQGFAIDIRNLLKYTIQYPPAAAAGGDGGLVFWKLDPNNLSPYYGFDIDLIKEIVSNNGNSPFAIINQIIHNNDPNGVNPFEPRFGKRKEESLLAKAIMKNVLYQMENRFVGVEDIESKANSKSFAILNEEQFEEERNEIIFDIDKIISDTKEVEKLSVKIENQTKDLSAKAEKLKEYAITTEELKQQTGKLFDLNNANKQLKKNSEQLKKDYEDLKKNSEQLEKRLGEILIKQQHTSKKEDFDEHVVAKTDENQPIDIGNADEVQTTTQSTSSNVNVDEIPIEEIQTTTQTDEEETDENTEYVPEKSIEEIQSSSSNEVPSNEVVTNEAQTDEAQTDETQTDKARTNEVPSNEAQTNKLSSNEVPSNEVPSNEAQTNKLSSNAAMSDEAQINEVMTDAASSNDQFINTLNLDLFHTNLTSDKAYFDFMKNKKGSTDLLKHEFIPILKTINGYFQEIKKSNTNKGSLLTKPTITKILQDISLKTTELMEFDLKNGLLEKGYSGLYLLLLLMFSKSTDPTLLSDIDTNYKKLSEDKQKLINIGIITDLLEDVTKYTKTPTKAQITICNRIVENIKSINGHIKNSYNDPLKYRLDIDFIKTISMTTLKIMNENIITMAFLLFTKYNDNFIKFSELIKNIIENINKLFVPPLPGKPPLLIILINFCQNIKTSFIYISPEEGYALAMKNAQKEEGKKQLQEAMKNMTVFDRTKKEEQETETGGKRSNRKTRKIRKFVKRVRKTKRNGKK